MDTSAGRRVGVAGLLAAIMLGSTVAGVWLSWSMRAATLPGGMDTPSAVYFLGWVVFAAAGAFLAVRVPGNALGWILLAAAAVWQAGGLAGAYRTAALLGDRALPGATVAAMIWDWSYLPGMVLVLAAVVVFPDGRLPSRRWGAVIWLLAGSAAAVLTGLALDAGPLPSTPAVSNPIGIDIDPSVTGVLVSIGNLGFVAATVAAAVACVMRYRRAGAIERHQIKWFAYAALLLVVALATAQALQAAGASSEVLATIRLLPMVLLPAAVVVAVLRFRLYDIDVVISKSLVYTALASFIAAVYIVVVVGGSALVGVGREADVPLSIGATVLVAVAFAPLRSWIQTHANRLVYGRRDSPYEVLASFADRVASVRPEGGVLTEMARLITEAVGGASGEVWLRDDGELRRAARWPEDVRDGTAPIPTDGSPHLPALDRTFPVHAHGRLVGALGVTMPRGTPLRPADELLLSDLASAAWLVVDNLELISELRASRLRLVAAQDAERARIERDLHDGAQQRLLEAALTLVTARTQADAAGAQEAAVAIDLAQEQVRAALTELRELARGIHPAILATRGLRPALESLAERAPLPVTIATEGLDRLPHPVEATAYFVTTEALTNVIKHADAAEVTITATVGGGRLHVAIRDDGVGGADADAPGLRGIVDRVTALDGHVTITSPPGRGTCLEVELPCA